MKRFVRKQFCKDETELTNAVHAFQKKLTPTGCKFTIEKFI